MKLTLTLLLGLTACCLGQTAAVTKNPNTGEVSGNLVMGPNRVLTFNANSQLTLNGVMQTATTGSGGQIQVNNPGLIFGSVDGMLTIQARDNHALIARTPNPGDGIALVGWSSSGASALKAVQDTHFNSPGITVWRDLSLGYSTLSSSAGVLVAATGPAGAATTQNAVDVQVNSASNFKITWNGFATSKDKPLCRFLGRLGAAPTGTYGTDYSAGDLYFNTSDSKFYCHDGTSWKAM